MATDHITRQAVKDAMHLNPGIRAHEIAKLLGIGISTAEKHVREIRAEWKAASE